MFLLDIPFDPVTGIPAHADGVTGTDWTLIAGLALAWLYQRFFRAPIGVPQWLGYVVLGVASLGLWLLASPEVDTIWNTSHDMTAVRALAISAVTFFFAVRGMAAGQKDAKIAPPADTKGTKGDS